MRVQCDHCGSSYTLPEARVAPGRRLQFQCRHCDHRIQVQVPAENLGTGPSPAVPAKAAATVAAAPPGSRVLWFVSSPSGQQQRMDSDGVRAAIRDGSVSRDTWLWRKGLAEWQRAGEAPDFSDAFPAAVPPLPEEEFVQQTASAHPVVEYASIPVVSGAHVAGSASVHRGSGFQTDQRAIPMPIIRASPQAADGESQAERRPVSGAQRPSQPVGNPRPGSAVPRSTTGDSGLRAEGGSARLEPSPRRSTRPDSETRTAALDVVSPTDRDDGDRDSNRWSPATDTYTGQRARMTRRVDEGDRDAAVTWADEQKRLQADVADLARQLRGWQRVGVAALVCLAVVLLVTLAIAYQYRQAQDAADRCAASAPEAAPSKP